MDASELNLSLMGTMNNGGGPGGFGGFDPGHGMPTEWPSEMPTGGEDAMFQMPAEDFTSFGGQAGTAAPEKPAASPAAASDVPEKSRQEEEPSRTRPAFDGAFNTGGMARQNSSAAWGWIGACALLLAAALILARGWKSNR